MSPKCKKVVFGAIGVLLALNILATIFGGKMDAVRQDVAQVKADAESVARSGEELKQIRAEVSALGERLAKIENLARSLAAAEQERLTQDLADISSLVKDLGAPAPSPAPSSK